MHKPDPDPCPEQIRSWSCLHESLHHSHYTYLPTSAHAFLPFKVMGRVRVRVRVRRWGYGYGYG